MWRYAHFGQRSTTDSGNKFGTAAKQMKNAVARIAIAFHREKYSIGYS